MTDSHKTYESHSWGDDSGRGVSWEVWCKACRMVHVDGDTRYGAVTVWYGAAMAHKLLSAHIIFVENYLPSSELYFGTRFLLYFTGCADGRS